MKRQALKPIARMEGNMNGIISYHIAAPGDLWVRTEGGALRRATAMEENTLLQMAPDLALQICWQEAAADSKVK